MANTELIEVLPAGRRVADTPRAQTGLSPTLWLTGLSAAGKTTIATGVAEFLRARGRRVEILDGAEVREDLGDFFGYSREERLKVNRVLCTMAKMLGRHGIISIVTAITPYEESREFNRRELGAYYEVYVECPVDVCMDRDRSGQYRRALRGDLKHFIGVDDAYEVPKRCDLRLLTAHESPDATISKTIEFVSRVLGLSDTRE